MTEEQRCWAAFVDSLAHHYNTTTDVIREKCKSGEIRQNTWVVFQYGWYANQRMLVNRIGRIIKGEIRVKPKGDITEASQDAV